MESLKLLLILPNINNQNILIMKDQRGYQVPTYDRLVDENVGFDDPDLYNKYFSQLTGIAVFRKYAFTHENYCVFVLEQKEHSETIKDACSWAKYDEMVKKCAEKSLAEILRSVKNNYHKSLNMPWVNEKGFASYLKWVNEAAMSKGFSSIGEITQIKNAYVSNVFLIRTNAGDLYLKIPGTIYMKELAFTQELMRWNIAKLPQWLDFDSNTNAILMKDMGGYNLPENSDTTVLKDVISQYARLQKESLQYIDKRPFIFYDYRIEAIVAELDLLPENIYQILMDTKYQIDAEELTKLKDRVEGAKELLRSLMQFGIPHTIGHGDLRPGNIRVTEEGYMFYDWSWCAITHPFISISQFLHTIRRTLPDASVRDTLIESYLEEWNDFGNPEQLKRAFSIVEELKYLFMAYTDYHWLTEIASASKGKIDEKSADGWLLSRRYYYFSRVLKRFIED